MNIYWPGTNIAKSRYNDFNWREREPAINWRTFGLKTAAAQAGAAATLRKTGGAAPVSLPGTFAPRKGGPLMKGGAQMTDKTQIGMWYSVAEVLSRSGVEFHVDHVLPLHGKTVSGLHTHDNLQVLPWFKNLRKSAKLLEQTT